MKNISKPALLDLLLPIPEDIETQRGLIGALDAARAAAVAARASAVSTRSGAGAAFATALFG